LNIAEVEKVLDGVANTKGTKTPFDTESLCLKQVYTKGDICQQKILGIWTASKKTTLDENSTCGVLAIP